MSKRFDNKKLLLVLTGLLAVLLLTLVVRTPKKRSTIREKLVDFDTASVGRILITPRAEEGKQFEFFREDPGWKVKQDNIVAVPRKNAIGNIFQEILGIRPQSLAAVGRAEWGNFGLTDSLATRIRFTDKKGRTLSDIMIGRFTYKPVANPYAGGRNDISGTSYVRLADEEKVYAVDGFLALAFSGGFDDWRDRTLLRCNDIEITKISFSLPADSSFVLTKTDSGWTAGNQPADSLNVREYLSSVSFLNGDNFRDGFVPAASPGYQIAIEGNNLLSITVKCYREEDGKGFVINSSQNPSLYFSADRGMFDKIFRPLSYFTVSSAGKKK